MNRLYRSIWNAARNTFVAVAENSRTQGKPASSSVRSSLRPLALEPRLMFDAAVVAAAVEAVHADTPAVADAGHGAALAEAAARLTQAVPAAVERKEIVFVENNVPDLASLLAGLPAGREVVVLDSAQDGLVQMAAYLQGRSGIDALHVVSHGAEAVLGLGSLTLTTANLAEHASDLATLRSALSEHADVLLYGCDVGAGSDGAAFVAALSQATHADVAASTNLTGAAEQGGDWVLERATGQIDAVALSFADYRSILPSVAGTVNSSGQNDGDDFGSVFSDGEGGSSDIAGIEYDIFFADSSNGAFSTVQAYNGVPNPLLVSASEGSADKFIIKSSGGENFKLTSFYYQDFGGADANWTVTAYDNGSVVGSPQLYTVTQSGNFDKTVTLSSDFENIDEVHITAAGGGSGGHIYGGFNNFVFANPVLPNTAPSLGNLSGDSVAWAGVGATVKLDSGGNATASDSESGALNSGNGDWGNGGSADGSLTVQRVGGAVSSDTFGFDTTGQSFTVSGSNLQSGGQTFATYTSTGGTLTVTFTSSGTMATTALVQQVMRSVTYRSDTPGGDAAIRFSLNDGTVATTADTTVTSDTIYITNATDTATIDRTDGVSFSEAVAIAAADSTGSQTLVFSSGVGSVTLAGNVAINESLVIDSDATSNLTLSGSTVTLATGTTLSWQNGSGDTATLASTLAGAGGLAKSGAGRLVLTSTGNSGGWSGAMAVTGGSLRVSDDGQLSSGTLTLDGGTLDNDTTSFTTDNAIVLGSGGGTIAVLGATRTVTLSGVISGSGALTKISGGNLTLTGTNTYSGGTSISGTNGMTVLGGANLGTGAVTINTGLTVGNAGVLSNNIVLGSSSSTVTNSVALTLSGTVSGDSLTKLGSGQLTLSGTNTYTGSTTVSNGRLQVSSDANLGAGRLVVDGAELRFGANATIDNVMTLANTATINTNGHDVTLSGVISGSGTLELTGGNTLVLSGTNDRTGTTHVAYGLLSIASDANLGAGTAAVSLESGTALVVTGATTIDNDIVVADDWATIDNAAAVTLSGALSGGTLELDKDGAGTLTLTHTGNAAGFGGGVRIRDGVLAVGSDSALVGGAVALNGGSLSITATTTIDNDIAVVLDGAITAQTGVTATFSGGVSDAAALTLDGAGTVVMTGTSTHTGTTTVTAGTLSVASDANLGSDTLTLAGGQLAITGAATIDNAIVLGSAATITATADATLSGVLSGAALTKAGSATLTLSNSANSQASNTITGGTLKVASQDELGGSAGVDLGNGATLEVAATVNTTLANVLSGTGTLLKSGAATLTLSGSNSGASGVGLTVSDGTLAAATSTQMVGGAITLAGGDLSLTSGAFANAIALSSAATVNGGGGNVSLSGIVSGSGALTKAGTGTLTLSGNNTFSGDLTVNAGVLTASHDNALGSTAAGTTVASGATLRLGNGVALGEALSLSGVGYNSNGALQANSGTVSVSGAVTLAANAEVQVGSGVTATLSGAIAGDGLTLSKTGSGRLTLSGSSSGSTWGTTLSAGKLSIGSASHLGSGQITLAGGTLVATGNTFTLANAIAISADSSIQSTQSGGQYLNLSGLISGSGALTKSSSGMLVLSNTGNSAGWSGGITVAAGTLRLGELSGSDGQLSSGTVTLSGGTLDISGNSATIDNAINLDASSSISVDQASGSPFAATLSGTISGSGVLTKTGVGTLTLSGSNSHASTQVRDGTLGVAGSSNLGSGSLTLNGGSLLLGGNLSNAIVLMDNATITNSGSATVSGAVSGSGDFTKAGSGMLALSGSNTGTGSTTVSAGALSIGSSSNLASGDLNLSGGNLVVTGTTTLTQNVALTQNATLVNSADLTLAGVVAGSTNLVKLGTGTLTLTNTNTTTGTLAVMSGALSVAGQAELGQVTLNLNGGSLNVTGAGSLSNAILIGTDNGTINNSADVSLTGALAGAGSLTKAGSGTLTLSDTGNEANLTGGLQVIGGTLAVADDDALSGGTLSLNGGTLLLTSATTVDNALQLGSDGGTVSNGGAVTLSGAIGGVGSLTKAGSGVLTLSGSNGYGATTVAAGTLKVAGDGNLGSGTVSLSAGSTLQVTGATTIDNGVALSGNATLRTDASVTLSGALSGGARALTKQGTGTLSLSNTANEAGLTGGITVMGGTVAVATDDALVGGTVTLNGGTLAISGATTIDNDLALNYGGGTVSTSAAVTWSGLLGGTAQLTKQGNGTLTLSNTGNAASHSGQTSVRAGTLAVAGDSQLGAGALTLNGGTLSVTGAATIDNAVSLGANNGSVNNTAALTLSGVVSGVGGLNKAGSGTLTLSATNTYTGYTAVDAGTLSVTGSLGGTAYVNVNGGTTLAGSGSVHGPVFVDDGATLAPGVDGIGQLTLDDGLVLMTGGGVLALQVDGTGAGHDQLVVHGTVNLNGGTLSLDLSQLTTTGGDSFVLIDNDGSDAVLDTFDGLAEGATVAAAGGRLLQVSYMGGDGNDVTLRSLNLAPVAGAIGNPVAAEDSAFAFTVPGNAITDADTGDTLSYIATLSSGSPLPTWLSFNPSTRAFSGTPGAGDVGAITVRVTASDGTASAHSDFTLTTSHVNHAPTTSGLSAQAASEGSAFGYTVPAFADADSGDTLSYTATLSSGSPLPTWLSFDPTTRSFSGTPAIGDVGALTVRVTASDGSASTHSDFALTVSHVNHAPTTSGLSAQGASEDSAFSFTVPAHAFADADTGDTLAYSATLASGSALPAWLSFDAGSRTFSGTPANGDVGAISVRVTASDGTASVHGDFTLTVANTNDAPATVGIANQAAAEDSGFSFVVPAGTFSDVDAGDSLTYSATLASGSALPAWLSFDATTRTFSGTPANGDVGAVPVRVTASDGTASTHSDFTLTVANTNDAPTTVGIANQAAAEDSAFSFTVPAGTFSDVDAGDSLTYSATLASGSALPAWLGFDATTRTFSGTPANGDVAAVSVRVTASDGVASVHSDFTLTVANTNDAPTTVGIANQAATEDSAFGFTVPAGTFSDADVGDSLTYSATLANGSALPAWLSFNAATRSFSGTPANGDVGALSVRVTASDGVASAHSDFTLTVANVNDAPTLAAPAPVVLTDTATTDAFANAHGQLAAADVDSGTLSFGLDGGSSGSRVIDGIAYDLSKAGAHGTLWLSSTTGQYAFVADAAAVNAEAHAAQDVFALSVSDGSLAAHANLTVAINGVDDLSQGSLTLSGDARVGQALTANSVVTDAEGVASVARQWQLEDSPGHWTDIAGATGATLTLAGDTAGHAVRVVAQVTDAQGAVVTLTSAPTSAVAALPPVLPVPDVPPPPPAPAPVPVIASTPVAAPPAGDTFVRNTAPEIGSSGPSVLAAPLPREPVAAPAPVAPPRAEAVDTGRSSTPLTALPDLGSVPLTSGSALVFQLPPSTFQHADASARLSVEVQQADGRPLPAWLKFDPAKGTLSGQAPEGFKGVIHIRIVARDAQGHAASSRVDLEVGGKDKPAAVLPEAALPPGFDPAMPVKRLAARPGLSEQLKLAGKRHATAERLAAAARTPRG